MMIKENELNRVDVHQHTIPQEYVHRLKEKGIRNSLGVPFPKWSEKDALQFMDRNHIKKSILSITAPGVSLPQ